MQAINLLTLLLSAIYQLKVYIHKNQPYFYYMILLFARVPIIPITKSLIVITNRIKVVGSNLTTHLLLMINIQLRDLFHQDILAIIVIIQDILSNFNKVEGLWVKTSSLIKQHLKINILLKGLFIIVAIKVNIAKAKIINLQKIFVRIIFTVFAIKAVNPLNSKASRNMVVIIILSLIQIIANMPYFFIQQIYY